MKTITNYRLNTIMKLGEVIEQIRAELATKRTHKELSINLIHNNHEESTIKEDSQNPRNY